MSTSNSDFSRPTRVVIWSLLAIFALPLLAWPWVILTIAMAPVPSAQEMDPGYIVIVAIGVLYPLWYGFSAFRVVRGLRNGQGKYGILWAAAPALIFAPIGALYLLEADPVPLPMITVYNECLRFENSNYTSLSDFRDRLNPEMSYGRVHLLKPATTSMERLDATIDELNDAGFENISLARVVDNPEPTECN